LEDESTKGMLIGKVLKGRATKVKNLEEEEKVHLQKKQQQLLIHRARFSLHLESNSQKLGEKSPSPVLQSTLGEKIELRAPRLLQIKKIRRSSRSLSKDDAEDAPIKDKSSDKDTTEEKEEEKVDPEKQRKDREARYNRRMSKRSHKNGDGEEDEEGEEPVKKIPNMEPEVLKKKVLLGKPKLALGRPPLRLQIVKQVSINGQPLKIKSRKIRRHKGYKYWGTPPYHAKKKKKPVAIVAPTSNTTSTSNVVTTANAHHVKQSTKENGEKSEKVPSVKEPPTKPTKANDEGEKIAEKKNEVLGAEDGEVADLSELSRFEDYDMPSSVEEMNNREFGNNEEHDFANFDDLRGEPTRGKEADNDSLRVIPSGPSSCNTVYDDSDFSSQPSVPPHSNGTSGMFENGSVGEVNTRSGSSCSGGGAVLQQPISSCMMASQQSPTATCPTANNVSPVNQSRAPVLVMPPQNSVPQNTGHGQPSPQLQQQQHQILQQQQQHMYSQQAHPQQQQLQQCKFKK
jgi:hypothetical protein